MKTIATVALASLMLSSASASAQSIYWSDWDSPSGSPSTGPVVSDMPTFTYWSGTTATIGLPNGGSIGFTLSGEISNYSCINAAGVCAPNRWTNPPSGTYARPGGYVPNLPTTPEEIAQTGYVAPSTRTVAFSQPVANVVMAVWSVGNPTLVSGYKFDQDFVILSQDSSCNQATNVDETGTNCLRKVGTTLYGKEGNGTILFLGKYSRLSWTVTDPEGYSSFTLGITSAPDLVAQLALQSTANSLTHVLASESAAIARGLDYDCRRFGEHGWCLSGGARYSRIGNGNISSGAGILIASYQPVQRARLGVFIDYAPTEKDPVGFDFGKVGPTWGGFVGYGNDDGAALQLKASAAVKMAKVTHTRDASLLFTEPGKGTADVRAAGFQLTAAYGFAVADNFLLSPFIGYRVGSAFRGSYNEESSESVAAPFAFDRFGVTERTWLSGVRAQLTLNERFAFQASAAVEKTLSSTISKLTGTTPISRLSNFSVDAPSRKSGARFAGEAGASYLIAKNNWVSATAGYRELSFDNKKDLTFRAMFTAAF